LCDTYAQRRGRRILSGAALAITGSVVAVAQSPIRDLYVEAAAVAEKCGVAPLDDAGIAKLATVIAAETKEQTPAGDVAQLLAKARAAYSGAVDCTGPLTAIHVQFFRNVVLPRIQGQENPRPAP
jgi:hypothetical protein